MGKKSLKAFQGIARGTKREIHICYRETESQKALFFPSFFFFPSRAQVMQTRFYHKAISLWLLKGT